MIEYRNEFVGMNGTEQQDFELGAWEGSVPVGYIAYSIYNNAIHIRDILVRKDRRREGIETGMFRFMESEHPGLKIHSGLRTSDGDKFWTSLGQAEKRGEHYLVDRLLALAGKYIPGLNPFLAGYWFSPSGEEFEFPGSSEHYFWVMHNMDMLNRRLGTDIENATEMQILLQDLGWVQGRITTGGIQVEGTQPHLVREFLQNMAMKIPPEELDKVSVHINNGHGATKEGILSDWL